MPSKVELQEIIENQSKQIKKYESRLIDLIRSYKSLQKEKAALQESFTTVVEQEDNSTSLTREKETEGAKEDVTISSGSESASEAGDSTNLFHKVKTLQHSVRIISIEKDKSEALLKEDRKVLLDENKKLEIQLESEKEENSMVNLELANKLEDVLSNLAQIQIEKERENNNGMTTIRELEAKLSKERHDKEKIESLLYSSKAKEKFLAVAAKSSETDQKQISNLQNELEQVRRNLNKAVHQCQEPPLLKELQIQMKEMQLQYRQAILEEQKRAESAELNVRQLSDLHEERVSSLEKKLTDLSLNAATNHRTKQNQQDAISILKDRVQELSQENTKLTSRESSPVHYESKQMPEADLPTLTKSLTQTWERINAFNEKTESSLAMEDLLSDCDTIHSQCRKKYRKIKQELDNVTEMRNSSKCSCNLQDQVVELNNRLRSLTNDANVTQKMHSEQIVSLTKEAARVRRRHETKVLQLEQEHKVAVSNLEQQLFDHCQKSLETLRERNEVISRLSDDLHKVQKVADERPTSVAAALLAQVETKSGMEGPLLHHLEEMARKEIEVVDLRRQKRQIERALRDLQTASIERQEFLQESVFSLEGEVKRQQRNVSREGGNLEYLKNVILKYMISSSGQSKHFMLNAISAVLKFSPEEIESVRGHL